MVLDWSPDGVDWRDESRDPELARDWLREARDLTDRAADLQERVWELTREDLDPPRGWRLVKLLVSQARTDDDLWLIGKRPLAWIVTAHLDLIKGELAQLYVADPKWRTPFVGQISFALHEVEREITARAREL